MSAAALNQPAIRATSRLRRVLPWLLLLGCIAGGVTLIIWAWAAPFALRDTVQINRKNFATLAHLDSALRWRSTLAWPGLWLLYALAAGLIRRRQRSWRLLALIGAGALALALPWLWAYPGTSLDIFDYNFRGHMLARLGSSPLQVAPKEIINDAQYPFLAWRGYVDAYGPLWEYVNALVNGLVNGPNLRASLIPALTAYRVLALLLHAGGGGLIYWRLRDQRQAPTLLWLWLANPLLLHEAANGGHNDGWMVLLVLVATLLVQRGRGLSGLLVLTLAAHFKVTALVALPGLGIWFWREYGWRRTWRALAAALPLAVALSWALYAPLGGWATLPRWFDERGRFVYASLAHWWALTQSSGKISGVLAGQSGAGATALFALALAVVLITGWRRRRPLAETQWLSWGLYLWVGTFWFQPWYVVWVLPWALLSRRRALIGISLSYAFLASCLPLLESWWQEPLKALAGPNIIAWLAGIPAALGLTGAIAVAVWERWPRRPGALDPQKKGNAMRMLLVVAKEPRPGLVKTRLGATLGHERAAELYQAFSADTFRLAQAVDSELLIAHWPAEARAHFERALGQRAHLASQQGADFGARLHSAFVSAAAAGATQMVLIGTDSPSLPAAIVEAAFAALDDPTIDAVLGPCEDGGWYLLGLRQPDAAIFTDVEWSSAATCAQTIARINAAGLRLQQLPTWYDIDTAADLPRLHADLAARSDASKSATLPLVRAVLAELT